MADDRYLKLAQEIWSSCTREDGDTEHKLAFRQGFWRDPQLEILRVLEEETARLREERDRLTARCAVLHGLLMRTDIAKPDTGEAQHDWAEGLAGSEAPERVALAAMRAMEARTKVDDLRSKMYTLEGRAEDAVYRAVRAAEDERMAAEDAYRAALADTGGSDE